jgi:hypothetical protein
MGSVLLEVHYKFGGEARSGALSGESAARVIHQNLPHQARCDCKEVGSVLPIRICLIHEPHVSLMHQRRWLYSVTWALPAQIDGGKSPQFPIDERRELIKGLLIALGPFPEQQGYFMGVRHVSRVDNACSANYLQGTSVSLSAAPVGTSVFNGWSGACTGSDPNVCSVAMNSNQTVTATFSQPQDFTLAPASTALTTQTGKEITDVLTLSGQNGFSGQVNLSCAVTGPALWPNAAFLRHR